jgi:predicted glycosyltransferase
MPRVLFYVQHLLGIGHLARASRIADALVAHGFGVTIVSGGGAVPGFPGNDIELIELPPIRSRDNAFSALVDEAGRSVDKRLMDERAARLLAVFRDVAPDVLMIEAFPFGRRQMRFELVPLLEAASASSPRPLIVSSVRDILQENRKPGRAEETVDMVNRYFDLVLVHGDPSFVTLDRSFPRTHAISGKFAYTGLVAPPAAAASDECFDVVVSCGGGAAAGRLLEAACEAAQSLETVLPKWCVITGPNIQADVSTPNVPPNVGLERFRSDFAGLLASAKLSISQAGYNTVCDILRASCPAVLVPFAGNDETEQTMRANGLASRGLAQVVSEAELNADRLVAAAQAALAAPFPVHGLDLDGASKSALLLRRRLARSISQPHAATC